MREFYTALEAKNPPPAEPQARRGPPQITPITTKLIQKPSCRTNERQILSTKLGGVTESLLKDSISSVCVPVLSHQWQSGPTNISGQKIESSERPTLCMSVCNHEVAIGSSDHALYTFDINTGRKQRQLYNRNFGHSEWVTCVTHISDGRIVSGGMDNKVCVWDATGVRCKTLTGIFANPMSIFTCVHRALFLHQRGEGVGPRLFDS
jgi:WD40 repeat protein